MSDNTIKGVSGRLAVAEEQNQQLREEVERLQRSTQELASMAAGLRDELDASARALESLATLYRKSRGHSADERAVRSMRKSAEAGRPFSISTWMAMPSTEDGAE